MITRSIEVMLSKPGIYVVGGHWGMMACEVDDAGRCWSVVPETMERDNELPQGGWSIHTIGVIFGPLARMPEPAKQQNQTGEQRIIQQPQPGEPPWPNSSTST